MVPMPMSMCVCVRVCVGVSDTYDYTCAHRVGFHVCVCVCHRTPPTHTLVSFACQNI